MPFMSAEKQRYAPGAFVTATRDDGSVLNGFVERVIDVTTAANPFHVAVSPRDRRTPSHRFLIRPLLLRKMPHERLGAGNDENNSVSSAGVLIDERAMIHIPPAERFTKSQVTPLPTLAATPKNKKKKKKSNTNDKKKKSGAAAAKKKSSKAIKVRDDDTDSSSSDDDDDDNNSDAAASDSDEDDSDDEEDTGGYDLSSLTAEEKDSFRLLHECLAADGRFDNCYVCGLGGDLLMCESCCHCAHRACCAPPLDGVPSFEWVCAVCTGKPTPLVAAKRFTETVIDLVDAFQALDTHGVFSLPVSVDYALLEGYGELVVHPVDLHMMKEKAAAHCYDSFSRLLDDVKCMTKNCRLFNSGNAELVEASHSFEAEAHTLAQRAATQLRDENVATQFGPRLLHMSRALASLELARKIDPLSVSLPDGAHGILPRQRGAAGVKSKLRAALPPALRHVVTERPPKPLVFPALRKLREDFPDRVPSKAGVMSTGNNNARSNELFFSPMRVTLIAPPSYRYSFTSKKEVGLVVSNCEILYTRDGSDPRVSRTAVRWTGEPVLLAETTAIRAIATPLAAEFADDADKATSAVSELEFRFGDKEAAVAARRAAMTERQQVSAGMSSVTSGDDSRRKKSARAAAAADAARRGGDDEELLHEDDDVEEDGDDVDSGTSTPLLVGSSQQQQKRAPTEQQPKKSCLKEQSADGRRRQRNVSFHAGEEEEDESQEQHQQQQQTQHQSTTMMMVAPPNSAAASATPKGGTAAPQPQKSSQTPSSSQQQQQLVVEQPGNPLKVQLSYNTRRHAAGGGTGGAPATARRAQQREQQRHQQQQQQHQQQQQQQTAAATMMMPDLPASWFNAAWLNLFMDKIDCQGNTSQLLHQDDDEDVFGGGGGCATVERGGGGSPVLTAEEKRVYARAVTFLGQTGPTAAAPPGIHEYDWKRVIRDYCLFVSINADLLLPF